MAFCFTSDTRRSHEIKMYWPKNDVDLVLMAQAGDKEAFSRLVDRYETLARRIALRMMGDPETARDLAQEAILQAYLSLDRLRKGEQFQSWLYGIVLNVCRSYRRDQKLNFLSLEALAGGLHFDALPFIATEPDPHTVVERRELHRHVLAAVGSLSPKNREATLLFYYEGMSLQEIADGLGISIVAVKGRLHKSRIQLREWLADLHTPAFLTDSEKGNKTTMIRVTIADIMINPENENRIVILMDEAGEQVLPIWIGPFEADAIALQLLNQPLPRPPTYEFTARLLLAAGAHLEEVRIEALKESVFYAVAKIRSGESVQEIDARPSDALTLALRMNSPIFVTKEVMETGGMQIPTQFKQKPLRKRLDAFTQRLEEQKKESAQKLEEAKETEASRSEAERMAESHQKVLAYLFGDAP